MADMAWEVKCREEDMKQRALENERHAIDDARRAVDEKAEQLKVLANQSALFAGFSMVVLVESTIASGINLALLTVFGGVTASVIALMLISSLNSTYMLVAILRYDCVNRDVPFDEFWRKRCDPDWKLALRAFSYGVPLFMVVVALVPWVTFWDIERYGYVLASGVVTSIAFLVVIFWFISTERKWTGFLLTTEARVLTRGMSIVGSQANSRRDSVRTNIRAMEGEILKEQQQVQQNSRGAVNDRPRGSSSLSRGESSLDLDGSLNMSSLAVGELTISDKKLEDNDTAFRPWKMMGVMRK